jgi:peptidoglycan/LPS O-acetylase OafA/YrhL
MNPMPTDALFIAGWLFTLGSVIAVSGRAGEPEQRALGGLVALLGLAVGAVAVGNWHEASSWGTATAWVLLALGGGACLVRHRNRVEQLQPSDATAAPEVPS